MFKEWKRVLNHEAPILFVEGTEPWNGTNPDWLESGNEMHWDIVGPDQTESDLSNAGFELVEKREVVDPIGGGEKLYILAQPV